uniref:Beta-defensin-like domain-containing protein n=1 Tax=Taeniopygia guttata TaxID=59729 RepID=H0ZST2_TAEGU
MKIFSFFFAVLLLMLQGISGFLRAPNTEVQCRQAGGVCSSDRCPPPHTRPFGRCQQGIPCCRTVVSPGCDGSHTPRRAWVGQGLSRSPVPSPLSWTPSTRSGCSKPRPT